MTGILEFWGLFEPVVVLLLLAFVVAAPIAGVVIYRPALWKRREQERMRREMEGKEHPRFTLDRTKKPNGKLKHIEANTMPLSLRKLVFKETNMVVQGEEVRMPMGRVISFERIA